MATFFAEVEFASSAGEGDFAFGEAHAEFDQFGDSCGAFFDDGADDEFFAETGTGFEGVADVHFARIFFAGDGGDAALGVIGVGLGAVFLGDDGDAAVIGDLESEG